MKNKKFTLWKDIPQKFRLEIKKTYAWMIYYRLIENIN